MNIPSSWAQAAADVDAPDGRKMHVAVWGWGGDESGARFSAAERLQRLVSRIARGEPFPDRRYAYADRPPREEILETFAGEDPDKPAALITRNGYGAKILNTESMLFLDVDLKPPTLMERIRRLFGGPDPEMVALANLRAALGQSAGSAFRIYRTASGFRVIGVDRPYDPTSEETRRLMQRTQTDAAFQKLCAAQRSFRARLTPKPWRCDLPLPPGRHPRTDADTRQRFASWLSRYESTCAKFATCRFVESVGVGVPASDIQGPLNLHDRETRCREPLPLA